MAFAVALFAASCSQDELLEDGGIEEVPVTFTATVDYAIETQGDDAAGNMKQAATRTTSTQDDAPTRFYAQAISSRLARRRAVCRLTPSGARIL